MYKHVLGLTISTLILGVWRCRCDRTGPNDAPDRSPTSPTPDPTGHEGAGTMGQGGTMGGAGGDMMGRGMMGGGMMGRGMMGGV